MMDYDLVIREEAQEEVEQITAWYEEQREGLGQEFVDSFHASLQQLSSIPHFQKRKELYRHLVIERFSYYRIVYTVEGSAITIYQVRHTSRRPSGRFGP
jgi:plasmid stabilization system protein ParE